MTEIVSRSLQFFAKPTEVSAFVSEALERKVIDAVLIDKDGGIPCYAEEIEKGSGVSGVNRFFRLVCETDPAPDALGDDTFDDGCWIRLQAPQIVDDTLLMAVLDTKGPPDRARLFARVARRLKKTLANPSYGFTEKMDHCVAYSSVWHSAGARDFLTSGGRWKQFFDGTVFFDCQEPPGKPVR
ncbi:MAG: hypothetical protein AAGF59_09145 [Pseudomonadota bacterium]